MFFWECGWYVTLNPNWISALLATAQEAHQRDLVQASETDMRLLLSGICLILSF